MTDFEKELRFLLDRLEQYDPEDDDHVRDFYGHVAPSIARMTGLLANHTDRAVEVLRVIHDRSWPDADRQLAEQHAAEMWKLADDYFHDTTPLMAKENTSD